MGLCFAPPNPQKPFDDDLLSSSVSHPNLLQQLKPLAPKKVQPGKKSGGLLFPSELFHPSLFCLIY